MPWAVAGAAVVGAAGSAYSANKAAGAQKGAADASNALQQQQYSDTVARNQPFVQGGTSAYNALLGRLGLAGSSDTTPGYGSLGKVPTSADVMATPGYQFGLDQGQQSLDRRITASGMNGSGAALKAAARYGTDYATTKYDDAFNNLQSSNQQAYNQLAGAAGMGQASANNTAAAGQQFATQSGNNLQGAANAQGAADIASGNALTGLVNQGASIYKGINSPSFSGSGGASNGAQMSTDAGLPIGTFANGGPVRAGDPVVGSRTPLPGSSTGGGMSKEAILAALIARQRPPQQAPSGMGALPANPLMSPGAILANQEQQAGPYAWGGPVQGPGTARSDSIPARLSNGEHVMDAASVTAMGGGDNERGQMRLNQLRARLKMKA